MTVVGIDLGTTNTVIAAMRDGRATALKDKMGRALLPSVVSFTLKGAPKVGYEAKNRRTIDPDNTVFSAKRLIGRTFDSEHVQKSLKHFPFELKEGPGKSTLVQCHGHDYTLPEISAFVLEQAQKIAEARLGGSATDAVITVPANFNDLQRAATKIAGRTAGLEVLRIINEPTAAALAYGFGKKGRERIAIYDFGGGTFDVTLLDLRDNVFEVLATAGDTFLGGDDIDRAIMDRMAEELLKKNKVDANSDNLVREQLRAAAEKLKIELSTRSMSKARIEELDFEFVMRRSEFEKLAEPLLTRTLEVCREAMDVAGIANGDLDQILMVGGSTRIPLVRRRTSSFFGKMPQSRINPDEVVAIGAAIQAATLEEKQGTASIPSAPLPRAAIQSTHPSRAPRPLAQAGVSVAGGGTKTGLAGLSKTLSGTGEGSIRPVGGSRSVLSGLQGLRGPNKTLAGVGADDPLLTQSIAGGQKRPGLSAMIGREKGVTNLGLGVQTSSSPAGTEPPPSRPKQDTIPGAASLPEDGSVTFDLAELEAMEADSPELDAFAGFQEETTKVVPPEKAAAQAAALDKKLIEPHDDLPVPVKEDDFEELGDSALFSLDDAASLTATRQGGTPLDADLPVPLAPHPSEEEAEELGDSSLFALEDEIGLPQTAASLPTPSVSLPVASAALPSPATALPSPATALPSPGEKRTDPLGATMVGLPAPLQAPLAEEFDELSIASLLPEEASSMSISRAASSPLDLSDESELSAPLDLSTLESPQHSTQPLGNALDSSISLDDSTVGALSQSAEGHRPQAPLLLDVTPLSLGVEVSGGYVDKLIERNSPIPCEVTRTFATTRDNQPLVRIRVSQGEEGRFEKNTVLGEVELTGLSQGLRGTVKVDVSFSLDESGMLQVTARDLASGNAADARLMLVGVSE